eukprot:3333106-Rhodomonas_salina.1
MGRCQGRETPAFFPAAAAGKLSSPQCLTRFGVVGAAPWRGEAAADGLCAAQRARGPARLHSRSAVDGA